MSATTTTIYRPFNLQPSQVVGRGLFSYVWNVRVALKSPRTRDNTDQIDREEQIYQQLGDHVSLLKYYGRLEDCLLLSTAENGTLRHYYAQSWLAWTIGLQTKLRWIEEVVDCVAFIHSKDIYHGDLSANNLLLDRSLRVKVADFGSAVFEGQDALGTYETSHCLPTHETPSTNSDLFALGSTIYEVLVGHKPYPDQDSDAVEKLFEAGQFPDLSKVPVCSHIIHKCWHEQYTSAREVSHDLAVEVRKQDERRGRVRSLAGRTHTLIWSVFNTRTYHTSAILSSLSFPWWCPLSALIACGIAVAWRQKLLPLFRD